MQQQQGLLSQPRISIDDYDFDCASIAETTGEAQWRLREKPWIGFQRVDQSSWMIVSLHYPSSAHAILGDAFPLDTPIQTTLRNLATAIAAHLVCSPQLSRVNNTESGYDDGKFYYYDAMYMIGNTGFYVVRRHAAPGRQSIWSVLPQEPLSYSPTQQHYVEYEVRLRTFGAIENDVWSTRAAAVAALEQAFTNEINTYQQSPMRYTAQSLKRELGSLTTSLKNVNRATYQRTIKASYQRWRKRQ